MESQEENLDLSNQSEQNIDSNTDNTCDFGCNSKIILEEEEDSYLSLESDSETGYDEENVSPVFSDGDEDDNDYYYNPASKEAIESMPMMKYRKQGSDVEVEEDVCVVCQVALEEGEEVRLMPCHHIFHDLCILQWLHRRHSCPQCRYQMASNPNPIPGYQLHTYPNYTLDRRSNLPPTVHDDASRREALNSLDFFESWQDAMRRHDQYMINVHLLRRPSVQEHHWFQPELRQADRRFFVFPRNPFLLHPDDCFFPLIQRKNRKPLRVTSDYDVDQILMWGPFDDEWFKSMVVVEAYTRSKHQRFFDHISVSRSRRRRRERSNTSWNRKMLFRGNTIIQSKGKI